MNRQFSKDFPRFKAKIHDFVVTQDFAGKVKEYDKLFNEMASISPDDMKEYVQNSPSFLPLRNRSLQLMERITDLHNGLDSLFKMDEQTLGKAYDYDLSKVDHKIAKDIKEAANLLHQFETISEQGRQAIEKVDSPFFSQSM